MHDIDNVRFESDAEMEQWGSSPAGFGEAEGESIAQTSFEFDEAESAVHAEAEDSTYGEAEAVFDEAEEMGLAGELLGVSTEAELDQFLGRLIRRAGRALGQVVRSPVGMAVGSLLKGAARRALPGIGSAIGGYLGGTAGAQLGSQSAAAAGRLFGLELEGLSGEDQEFEVARRFVRFSGEAVRRLLQSPQGRDVLSTARNAIVAAARRHAPGLLRPPAPAASMAGAPAMPGSAQSGRWTRRGNKIVLLGL